MPRHRFRYQSMCPVGNAVARNREVEAAHERPMRARLHDHRVVDNHRSVQPVVGVPA